MSPICGLRFEPCKAIRRRKIFYWEKLHILCKIDGILSKNSDLSLHCVARVDSPGLFDIKVEEVV